MGLFSDIISAVGNVGSDIFGGGSGSNDDNQKRKQQNAPAPQAAPLVGNKVNLSSVLKAPSNNLQAVKPLVPVFNQQQQQTPNNLTSQPIGTTPAPSGGGLFHDLLHNPVTHFVKNDVVSPTINAGKDVGEVAAAAVPEVGLGIGRVGTGIVQGVTQLPHIATALTATGTKALASTGLPGAGELNNLAQGANTGVKDATNFVDKPINAASRGLDTAAKDYSTVGPLAGMGEQDYKDTQVPLNVLAGLLTLGGGTAAEAAGEGGEAAQGGGIVSKISDFLNKPVVGDGSDAVSKTAQAVQRVASPVVNAVNAPISSVIKGVRAVLPGAEATDEAAGATANKAPTETGTKAVETQVDKPVDAPSGATTGAPPTEPGAIESGVKPVTPPPAPLEADNTPAYIRAPIKAANAAQETANKAAIAEKAVPTTELEKTPAFQHQQNIKAVISQGNDELNEFANAHPDATPQEIDAAKQAITSQVTAEVQKLQDARYGAPAESPTQSTPTNMVINNKDEPPAAPVQAPATPAAPAPALDETGNKLQDLQNATAGVQHTLENGRDLTPEANQGKSFLQNILDRANAHLSANQTLSRIVNSRLGNTLNDQEASNVRDAIETGNAKGLTDKEATVHNAIKENIEKPSNVVRTNLSDKYEQADNHFPQVRQTSVRDAASGAAKARGLGNKVNTFQDLLNRNSRFSQGSSLGKFTDSSGKTLTGDSHDLGLVAKKDGSFVNKSGKVYSYARSTSKDLEKAGVKLQSPKDAITAYARDTLNLKTRGDAADFLVKNADQAGLSADEVAGKSIPLTIKGSDGEDHTFFTDSKTDKDIKASGIIGDFNKDANLPTRAWNALSSAITQSVVANPTVDSVNRVVNGVIGSGIRRNGIGGLTTLKGAIKPLDDVKRLQMEEAGVHFPSFGKDSANLLSKATGGLSKLNEKAISAVDSHMRSGMFDSLKKGGMSDQQAAQQINRVLGGRSIYNKDGAQLGMFWKYFVRQNVNAAKLFSNAAKGHPGELINAAIAAGATYETDKGLQSATGNKAAYVHAPGMIGAINDVGKVAEEVKDHQYQQLAVNNPVISHLNPLIPTVAEQILGVNSYGDKFASPQARLANAEEITPETNLANNNGRSTGEKVANTFGVYTPHIAGDMATDNPKLAPVLNVKNAQNGSSTAFPKDFTGEQEENAVNQLGGNYSTKSAAIMGTQTQNQQKAYVAATSELKKVGVTDAADVQSFSKLSGKDQISYIKAATSLNTAGTAISNTSIQSQLVKEGNISLAASMNKDIPSQLPPEAKTTLETYSTLGTGGQKDVWLQNNGNADNYYKAVIAQKQAQGALTTDDTDTGATWSGSGNSLYVKALVAETDQKNNVSQETQELYKNTDLTKYKDMTGAEKTALTTYAQQLNAAGVMDKYDLYEGGDSSSSDDSGYSDSSSGSSASDLDRAAGMPDGTQTLLKPKDNSNLKAADTAKYVAPKLLDDKPSSHNGNPFIRSISVSKGLK
jgi:hypothetical protein